MLLNAITINSEQGLVNEQVQAVRQDRFGRLWLAGPVGMSCYNGSNIKVYDTRHGLECSGLRTLSISKENTIWIGTDRGIEAMKLTGVKIPLKLNFDWTFGIADSIYIEGSDIWIGTSYGLLKLKAENHSLDLVFSLDLGLVQSIIKHSEDAFLAVTGKQGLVKLTGSTWEKFCPSLPDGDAVICVAKTVDHYFLVGTTHGLYWLSSPGEIIEHFELSGKNNKVSSIAVLGDEWWFGLGHRLVLVSPDQMGIQVREVVEIGSIINDLIIDERTNIWLGTNNMGLKKITCLRDSLKQIPCQASGSVFSIKKEPQSDQLLIGGDGYSSLIGHFSNEAKRRSRLISNFPSIVWDTCFDPNDKSVVWYATQSGLFRSEDNGEPVRFEVENQLINGPNRVLLTRKDEIWLGTISGLFRIIKGEVTEILNHESLKFGYVYTLSLGVDNQIWIGTLGQGLWQETADGFKHIHNQEVSKLGNVYAVTSDQIGNTIVIQEEKVILIDKEKNARLVINEYPLAGWSVTWIDEQTIAIGSNNGIILLNVESSTIIQRISPHLNKADWQFTCSRSLYLNSEQKLFCGLNLGLFVVDLNRIKNYSNPPRIWLDELAWQNVEPVLKNKTYKVKAGKWAVSVSVYSAWFVDEKQIQYRFKLVGFDTNWPEFNTLPSIRFNSLPPGNYELQVQAYTPLTGISDAASLFRIEVSLPNWVNPVSTAINELRSRFNFFLGSGQKNKLLIERNLDLEREIEDRKKVERELENYKDRLEEIVVHRTMDLEIEKEKAEAADKMKSAFLANMSHEIRTPIGGIIGLLYLLRKSALDGTQADYVSKIDYSAKHLLQIINDLLDVSKIEAGKMEIDKIPFNLEEVLREIETFREIKKLEKDIAIVLDIHVKNNDQLIGDPLRIKQVLINLMANAFKFTNKGEIRLSIEQVESVLNKVNLKFSVTDTGIGMTEEQLGNIFQMFNQADSSISRKYGGTGLGLGISHSFVELMGGKLQVESKLNEGSSFFFTLTFNRPTLKQKEREDGKLLLANGESSNADGSAKSSPKQEIAFELSPDFIAIKHAKILIAEDDKINQLYISRILKSYGFEFHLTSNGQECIDALEENPDYDIILMDVQMPGMDGLSATKYIREQLLNQNIKIIALTADALSGTKERVISVGMNDYLIKPVVPELLFEKFVKWIQPATSVVD